jgi:HK97 family phage major capsid protein
MKKSFEFIKERAALIEAQKRLHEAAEKETRSLNEAETKEFRDMQGQIEALNEKIKDAEAYEANLRMMAQTAPSVLTTVNGEERELDKMKEGYSLYKAMRSQMQNGEKLSGVELEFHQEAEKRAKVAGVSLGGLAIPTFDRRSEKRADGQTVTQDSGAYGGNLVATEQRPIIEMLRPKPVLEMMGATFLTGLQGNLKFPVNNGGIAATWEGEVDTVPNSKNAYGSKTMTPKRLSASVLISLQNIMQSVIDLEKYTIDDINNVIALAIDTAGINGTGTNDQPTGILNVSGTNPIVGGANGAAPTWANVVQMESSVFIENANAARMNYLINPVTRGKLKTTKHEAGDLGYLMGTDNTINGYGVGTSNLMPSNLTKGTGTGLSAAIFGDFSQLYIGQWGFLDLSVDDKSRKKEGYVEVTVNTFVDLMIRQPKAFSIVKDWITT